MINPTILSGTNADDAQMVFTLCINDITTLLVALGTHDEALKALSVSNDLINSGSPNYSSVRAVHAPNPGFILTQLMKLKPNPDMKKIDWSKIGDYAVLSVSNKMNYIGDAFSNKDFRNNEDGKINYLVLQAQSVDDQVL